MNGPVLLFVNRGMRALFLHLNSRSRFAKTGSVDTGLNGNFTAYSPTNLETKSDEDTEKNVLSASVAQALARYVFPVPGGYFII